MTRMTDWNIIFDILKGRVSLNSFILCWPPGVLKGPILARNAPVGALGGPQKALGGYLEGIPKDF